MNSDQYNDYEMIKGGQSKQDLDVDKLRENFISKYCISRGWDISNLTPEQLNEIKSQKGYTNPGMILG